MYSCILCEYNTNYKSNYERHIKSKKHLLQTNELNEKNIQTNNLNEKNIQINELNEKNIQTNNLNETNIQKNELIKTKDVNIQTNVMDLSKYYICFLLGYMFGINSCIIIIYIEPITNFILDNSLILDILGTYSK
tara:strand:- start:26 stop:430 length:405 start_codon:yes stop_codon:yes gene_type:complete